MNKSFNIQELLRYKSKHHGTKLMHPSYLRAFQKDQEHDLRHPGLVDLISTNKTNKLPSFIDKWHASQVQFFLFSMSQFDWPITQKTSKYGRDCHLHGGQITCFRRVSRLRYVPLKQELKLVCIKVVANKLEACNFYLWL